MTPAGFDTTVADGGRTKDPHPILTGSAEAGAIVSISVTDALGAKRIIGTTTPINGTWSFTVPVSEDGMYTYQASILAPNHETTLTQIVSVTIDTAVGPASIDNFVTTHTGTTTQTVTSGGTTNDAMPDFSGYAELQSTVKVYEGSGSLLGTATLNGTQWILSNSRLLSDGPHEVYAVITDSVHNEYRTNPIRINIDTRVVNSAINLTINTDTGKDPSIQSGAATKDNTPTLTGTAEAGSTVMITRTAVARRWAKPATPAATKRNGPSMSRV